MKYPISSPLGLILVKAKMLGLVFAAGDSCEISKKGM